MGRPACREGDDGDGQRGSALVALSVSLLAAGCLGGSSNAPFARAPTDPASAPAALVDRFSPEAGGVAVRSDQNHLPGPGVPIDFDQKPFLVQGLGPDGRRVRYYDFDMKSQVPAKMYVFVRDGTPIDGQLPVITRLPGQPGYNDFWRVHEVWVRADYQPNSVTSEEDLIAAAYLVMPTERIVNRIVVPPGSTARQRFGGGDPMPGRAWFQGQIATTLDFEDDVPAQPTSFGELAVDLSYIWATFNINPGQMDGGPPSGLKTESDGVQTHDVVQTVPGDAKYSPLWMVFMYDNTAFDGVLDLDTAMRAPLVPAVPSPLVNCPVVFVEP